MTETHSSETRELVHDGWTEYLEAVSKELVDAPVSVQVSAVARPRVTAADGLVLRSIRYDHGEDMFEVAATHDDHTSPVVMRHAIDHPIRIEVDSHTFLAPMTIAVDGPDDEHTVIRIYREAERAA